MARTGDRAGRVLSSGRLPLPLRPVTFKKRWAVRKSSTTSVDSGYSLCSTDSEDQVLVINRGLDRCAALLHDLLQCDVKESQLKPHTVPCTKGNVRSSTMKAKKTAVRKQATAAHVHKERGPLRTAAPALCNAAAQRRRVTSPPLIVPPYDLDHVTTQMQRLIGVSAPGPEASARYNCRLPTSTPARSPQRPAAPRMCGNPGLCQTAPPGGIAHFPSSMPGSSAFSVAGNTEAPALQNAMMLPGQQAAHRVPESYKSVIRDADLLQCVAAHLAQLQQTDIPLQNKAAAYTGESDCERGGPPTQSDDDDAAGAAPVRAVGCQTSLSKHQTPEKTEKKIQTVKCLLGDIKSLVADRGDEEAKRLVTQLENRVSLLPAAVSDINVHAEIALALQPLRSENAQLRRRLRILNQQLRDRERGARTEECSSEVTSLQSMNEALQKSLESLQREHQELRTALEAQKEESRRTAQRIQEKEREICHMTQQSDITSATMQKEVAEATGKVTSVQFKLEAAEKENQILGIALRQRDAEVARLRELTRSLQASMAKLLCDLGKDAPKPKPGSSLTRAALGSYDRQVRSEEGPASTSILNYLKRLETDQVFTGMDAVYSDRPLLPPSGQASCGKGATADMSDDYRTSQTHMTNGGPQSARPAAPNYSPQEPGSESLYLSSTEQRPDDTLYLPLVSSPCKYDVSLRRMCTPPEVHSVPGDLGSGYPGHNHIPRRSTDKNLADLKDSRHLPHTSDPSSETPQHDHRLEAILPETPSPSYQPPVLPQMRSLQVRSDPTNERSVCEGKPDWSICSFSTFTSHDEQDFRNGLAALDANIAELQRTLHNGVRKTQRPTPTMS
ncbi:coiled-coil domain-containing protein 14 isoform 1-T1 [Anomaloglossus baeobatrachus]|uniref:coiled-coil domain-containing protein 14 isoform X2 n=2 Tax=Anomaloglossus baeobatrachus TaxID=238106 RepID=UPI003F503299